MSSYLLLLIVHAIECQLSLYSSGIGIVIGIILGVVGVVIVLSIKGIFYGRQSWWCFGKYVINEFLYLLKYITNLNYTGYSRNVRHDAVRVIEEVPLLSISNKRLIICNIVSSSTIR